MLWAALSLPRVSEARLLPAEARASLPTEARVPLSSNALAGLATWALQFTPRVAFADEALVMELRGSVRLFGGKCALRDRVVRESHELGVTAVAWAPTSLAALALARAGIENGFGRPLEMLLDTLPIEVLSAAWPHRPTLARLGCKTLGELRKLPRGGVARRFDKALLAALDTAYGSRPEVHAWHELPETFEARLELMSRVESAPPLLFGARRLLLQLCGWLAARHCGVTAFTLRWAHDFMRSREVEERGELTIRTAEPTRDIEHLCRLLAEHLARLELAAPVGELELLAAEVRPLDMSSASLLPDKALGRESLNRVLERVAARLGPERTLRPVLREDHRPEWMTHWRPAGEVQPEQPRQPTQRGRPGNPAQAAALPQPAWILNEPLQLALRRNRPIYQGVLQLLSGPHRVEGGWWHRTGDKYDERTHNVQRDYWVARSEHAGVLWICQERLAGDETAWYLHGVFA